jgi:hypothetical protein
MLDIQTYLDRITSQHKVKPKYMALLKARLQPFIDIAECLDSFDSAFDLDVAVGKQLDVIGEYVGVSRLLDFQPVSVTALLDDDNYRTVLRARISLNRWDGTMQGVFSIWEQVFPDTQIEVLDNQDMTIDVVSEVNDGEDPLFSIELGVHGYILPKPMGVKLNFKAVAKKRLSINANLSSSAFVITHTKTGTKPRWAVILGIDGLAINEALTAVDTIVKYEHTSKNLHSGTNPVRIVYLDIDGVTVNESFSNESFIREHTRSGTKPHEAVTMSFQSISVNEQGEILHFTTEPPATSEGLHSGAKSPVVILLEGDETTINETLGKEVYGIEHTRAGTKPQPSVLGDGEAEGIETSLTATQYSVRYRSCGTRTTKR